MKSLFGQRICIHSGCSTNVRHRIAINQQNPFRAFLLLEMCKAMPESDAANSMAQKGGLHMQAITFTVWTAL